ncbi:MBOAT family protein [Alteromonas sp. IB21]|uniref:MBOAT family O-acyltransferase n=1 Tax=Alteromonas sp. IB21 TaxID=2779369 RepID=UPI0018E8FD63|nr:MBOAT family protein [Alteromonas sp. IB21]MBJ2130613.1 MBOAT family protein [Alteromonas sp. IB21]
MLFSSTDFIFVFFPLAVLSYYVVGAYKSKYRNYSLVFFSLFFYAYWKVEYLPILIVTILVNFAFGRLISIDEEKKNSKIFLFIGISLNAFLLGTFKYFDFFTENFGYVSGVEFEPVDLILPLAISFFTFQQIAFLVDCYKGEAENYTLTEYFLFVSFFPQLIAGPIVHHKQMMPQFSDPASSSINFDNITRGLIIFSIGLFKKIVIADHFGAYVDAGYSEINALNSIGAWSVSLSYTVQLYYDFSGYCDMAIGTALFFNIKLPINFNSPYKALNIQDFWRRWHITLSNWLRDYIYIPLGGSRNGSLSTYRNLFLTFLFGGFWHGAGWGFIFWGMAHGTGLIIHRLWSKFGFVLPKFVAWFITILYIHLAWVLFRAETLHDAGQIYRKMFDIDFNFQSIKSFFDGYYSHRMIDEINSLFVLISALILIFMSALLRNSNDISASYRGASYLLAMTSAIAFSLGIFVLAGQSSQVFLYFNF